jgi:hypothetical protein
MAKGYSTGIRAYVKETLSCAIESSWLVLSASGTFVKFTQAAEDSGSRERSWD